MIRGRPLARRHANQVVGAAAPVTPLTIIDAASVVAAYDASTVVLNGGNVSGVPDQSPNGWNGAQATAGFQPLWNASDAFFGGNSSIEFDAVDDIIDFTLPIPAAGTTPRHYWWIGRIITWTNGKVLFGGNGGLCQDVLFSSASPQIWQYNGTATVNSNNGSIITLAKRCRALFTNSASDRLQAGSVSISTANSGNGTSADWHLGGGGAAGQFSRWALSYMMITNRDLTVGERSQLDSWALGRGYFSTILT
jgi:hypothetical protein